MPQSQDPGPSKPPPPSQKPKFRILSPEVARVLSSKPSSAPTERAPSPHPLATSTSRPPPNPDKPTRPFHSFLSRLRNRYTTLPLPIRGTLRALRFLLPAIPIGIFVSEHVAQVMWVRGPSMTPLLNEDYETMQTKSDVVLVNMWPWGGVARWPWELGRKRRLERGMVVTFRSPANPSHIAIKRVIGLPGDRIITRDPCMKPTQIVPFNHVWVEGDAEDPRKTLDSNTYGPVSISLLTGRVMAVLWPRWRWLRWEDWERGLVDSEDVRRGEREGEYRRDVRERVVKEAVKIERPLLE